MYFEWFEELSLFISCGIQCWSGSDQSKARNTLPIPCWIVRNRKILGFKHHLSRKPPTDILTQSAFVTCVYKLNVHSWRDQNVLYNWWFTASLKREAKINLRMYVNISMSLYDNTVCNVCLPPLIHTPSFLPGHSLGYPLHRTSIDVDIFFSLIFSYFFFLGNVPRLKYMSM